MAFPTSDLPDEVPDAAKICAEATGYDWSALNGCVASGMGTQLYKDSVYYTSNQIAKGVIPAYGTGKTQGIPILRIAGVTHKGTIDAYADIGQRICKAAGLGPSECGCFKKSH